MKTGLVLTVGGSPEPVRHAIARLRPDELLLVVTAESRLDAQTIVDGLDFRPQYDWLELADRDDLLGCFAQLYEGVEAWRARRGLRRDEVTVDITGGTKPMAAALALAGCEWFRHFTYTGGERREAGKVVSGSERPVASGNPWDVFALRECALAQRLLDDGHAEAAAEVLDGAAERARDCRPRLELLRDYLRLLAAVDRFAFAQLQRELGKLRRALELVDNGWVSLEAHWQALEAERGDKGGARQHPATLRELLANAGRRAGQGRYDDAVARLYRAAELLAQDGLQREWPEAALGEIKNRGLSDEQRERLARAGARPTTGGYTLDKSACVKMLDGSTDPELRALGMRFKLLDAPLQARNDSVLAHGLRPVGNNDYQQLRAAVLTAAGLGEAEVPVWPPLDLANAVRGLGRRRAAVS